MGKVHIRKITLQSFRAFQDRQSSKELPINGLVGVRGYNRDTGGSSGAGKSTVALGIAYAFGFLPFPAVRQQNWHSRLPMQVELELDTPQGPATLRRGKEFSLTWNGKTVNSPAKSVEEAIAQMTGLPTDLLQALTYRQQKKPGLFLTMKDVEKKEFLGTLLGTSELEAQIAEATKKSNALQVEVEQLSKVIEALEGQLRVPEQQPLLDKAQAVAELEQAKVKLVELQAAYNQAEKTFQIKNAEWQDELKKDRPVFVPPATRIAELEERKTHAQMRIQVLDKILKDEKAALRKQIDDLNGYIETLNRSMADKTMVEVSIRALEAELKKLSEARCPTCSQEWEGAEQRLQSNQERLQRLNKDLQGFAEVKKSLFVAEKDREKLIEHWNTYANPTIDKLVEIRQQLEREIFAEQKTAEDAEKAFRAKMTLHDGLINAKYAVQLKELNLSAGQAGNEARMQILEIENRTKQVAMFEGLNKQIEENHRISLKRYEDSKAKVETLKAERDAKQNVASEEADYAAAVKKYLGLLFDEVLVEISAEANELLKGIPNTPTTTITFSSETQTKAGKVNQEIKPVIIKNGKEIDFESGISGGQLESLELAIDLSITKVIGERTGVRPGFMIFDESFSAHCLPVKQACMEVLKKASNDCLILVIDHATELRDYFDSFIDVESERDVSRFMVE